ncbi:MAG: winged helix-turn-helix transcriptional regulator [Balneolaceae bacterium]|nr:winged helix-turn-helix transcriptional regulator [Balneolaceae bacterium]MBO6546297.1 winged helix-turn-helix transcriptional regulator [Balneolaceae bacterium]MBO6648656.1 winged helix-turn-helix transcriptional regulator [Balneolaceae bacterium]
MNKQNCIRDIADLAQITRCRNSLSNITASTEKLSDILKLAGNDVRLKILYLLNQEHHLCPCDLGDILDMSVPAVSQHLRKLKDGGLVETQRDGKVIFYSINQQFISVLKPCFDQLENNNILKVTAA